MSSKSLHIGRKEILWILVISWLFLIPITQQQTTVTEYSTITETEVQTVIKTMTTTILSTITEESEYETYTIVATTTIVLLKTYRLEEYNIVETYYSTEPDGDVVIVGMGEEAGWSTIYYLTPTLMFVTTEIKITSTDTVTLTESVESTYLTESLTTKTKLSTIELLRTYEAEEREEPETEFIAIPRDYLLYGVIIALIVIVAALTLRGKTKASAVRYCTNCGTAIPRGQKFCPKCGPIQE